MLKKLYTAVYASENSHLIQPFSRANLFDALSGLCKRDKSRFSILLIQSVRNFRVIGHDRGMIYQLGDEVKVRVKNVDLIKKQFDFEMVVVKNSVKKPRK